jgi:ribosomal protein S18 acetylase RimI-like enzyme
VFRESGRPVAPVAHFASPGALLAPDTAAFVARVGDRPVACAMAVMSGAEAGVYWVATRPDARRRGIGELVTRAAVRAGFERGARVVVLQSTEQGVPLYRRLGFSALTGYARYG